MRLPQRILILTVTAGLITSLFASVASAQIQVNEFMADSNTGSSAVISDANGEWVEITNTSDLIVDLSNWTIETGLVADTTPTIDTFPINSLIAAGSSIVVCDNDNPNQNGGVACDYDLSISLTNNDGKIVIKDSSNSKVDEVTYYSANTDEIKPSDDYEDIQEGASATVVRDDSGEQTGTTNEQTKTFGPKGDTTDADTPAQYGSPASNTVYNQNNPDHAYATLQEAIDDASTGDTILVEGDQTLAEDVMVDRAVTISSTTACEVSIEGTIVLKADDTILSNITLTNPNDDMAVEIKANNVTIKDNCIKNVGSNHASGRVNAVVIDGSTEILNNVKIVNNTINNVVSDNFNATGIIIEDATNVTITHNSIENIIADNNATAIDMQGDTDGVLIKDNLVSLITSNNNAYGIALSGETPNTLIQANQFEDIVGQDESIGILNQDDTDHEDIPTITLRLNTLKNIEVGVQNSAKAISKNILYAQMNLWGGEAGPTDAINGDASLPQTNKGTSMHVVGAVDYRNWTGMTTVAEPEEPPVIPVSTPEPVAVTLAVAPAQAIPSAYQFAPANTQSTGSTSVAGDTNTTNEEPAETDEKQVIASAPTAMDSSWLSQNWLIVLVIVLGGGTIWYFFVRPNEI